MNQFNDSKPTNKVTFQEDQAPPSQSPSNALHESEDTTMLTLASSRQHIPSMPRNRTSSHRPFKQRIEHIWHGLPRAAKATVIIAFISAVLLIAYGITTVSLRSYDEEAHIATVIIILAIFILFATVDAVLYENTLQLISGIILSLLMMARMLWFICTRPENSTFLPLKVIWGALITLVQVSFIIASIMSCREFGWRLYSKFDVDYRRKGAASMQNLAMVANGYNTLVKLDFFFLVTFCALGIDVAVEHRDQPDAAILAIAILTFFVDGAIAIFSIVIASSPVWRSRLWIFDVIAPLSFAGPIAVIVLYIVGQVDTANAGTSIVVGGCVFMVTRLGLWAMLHVVVTNITKMTFVAGRVAVKTGKYKHTEDSRLAPLFEGSWLGKPAPRNPKKIRFFQLSHDGSTLRWGWKKYVRLYYAQDVIYDAQALTITMTFLLDPELTLKFPDKATFVAWQSGIDHLLVKLMTPEGVGLPGGGDHDHDNSCLIGDGDEKMVYTSQHHHGTNNTGDSDNDGFMSSLSIEDNARKKASTTTNTTTIINMQTASSSRIVNDEEVMALEEGLLRNFGMRIFQRGKDQKKKTALQQQQQQQENSNTTAVVDDTHDIIERPSIIRRSRTASAESDFAYNTTPTTTAAPATPTSSAQLQKRQRMAALLLQVGGSVLRRQGGKSPLWPGRSRSMTSPTSTSSPMATEIREQSELSLDDSFSSPSKRIRSVSLVSIGTQTDDSEFPSSPLVIGTDKNTSSNNNINSNSSVGVGIGAPQASTSTTPSHDADIAAHYASMFAAAAAASTTTPTTPTPAFTPTTNTTTILEESSSSSSSLKPHPLTLSPSDTNHFTTATTSNASPFASPTTTTTTTTTIAAATTPRPPLSPSPSHGKSPSMLQAASITSKLSLPHSSNVMITVDVIEFDELQLGKLLGSGSEGAVYAAWYLETPVAVKRFNRVEDSVHEVGMYLGVGSHDNVVALRALCQHEDAMYLVLEYCPRGTLDAMLHHSAPQQWDPAKLLPLVRSIARGMHHLHMRGIIHRDLKPANIFVGHGQTMKVGDFGMARWIAPIPSSSPSMSGGVDGGSRNLARLSPGVIGTSQYAAPELVNEGLRPQGNNNSNSDMEWAMKIDVWSFGVTLWEIMERKRPFDGLNQIGVEALWLNTPYQARLPPVRIPENLDASSMRVWRGLGDLVEDCTRLDPLSRPSFGDILRRLRGMIATGGSRSGG